MHKHHSIQKMQV